MIFAQLDYPGHYADIHHELLSFVERRFDRVEAGLQGDSWIWIWIGDDKVELDTFLSMKHQIKSSWPGNHVQAVIEELKGKYSIQVYPERELEPHEPG